VEHAVVVMGKRLVPEALERSEIVAVGQPLELGPLAARHELDRVGAGINKLADQVQQIDIACNRRLRREEAQRHAAGIIPATPPQGKNPTSATPQFATE